MDEHEDVINHLTALRAACHDNDSDAAAEAARALGAVLHPHTHTEEVSLFAEMRLDPEFTDHVDGLCSEHEALDRMLDAITAGDLTAYDAFELALRAHIDKEDNGLFPAAAIGLNDEQWTVVHQRAGLE